MPGLDPGIHRASYEASFSKKMDCRVKPGNDDCYTLIATSAGTHSL